MAFDGLSRRCRALGHSEPRAPVEHGIERRGETLMTAREAGTPTRLVRSNALLDGACDELRTTATIDQRRGLISLWQCETDIGIQVVNAWTP